MLIVITLILLILSYLISKYLEKIFLKHRTKLLNRNTKLREIQKVAKIGDWELDLKTNKAHWSTSTLEIFGVEDMSESFGPEYLKTIMVEDDWFSFESSMSKCSLTGSGHLSTYRIKRPNDGKLVWIECHGNLTSHNSILGIVQDVTEKQDNLKQLQQKKQELESIISNAPNPMLLHEEGGKVLMLNQSWTNSSGFTLEDTPTINDWIDNTRDDEETIRYMKKHIASLYEISETLDEGEFTFLNKNRDLVTWQVSSAPLGVINGKRTIITTGTDITELKHKDNLLLAQSRHAAMGEMIGMIAHQWRQPLSTISMNANNMLLDIALGDLDASASEKYAHDISAQTQHLSKTIDDFRNFFKPDKEILKVNIKDIHNQTLSIVQDSLKNNNIELISSFETDKQVEAYPRELMQVFVNIITNAKDALVSNRIKKPTINVRVYENSKYINTEIYDNGGGIDAKILSKVFDPYFSTKGEMNGTGIGLYMSKMIIENHLSGKIDVSNKKDGACFTVRLLKERNIK